MDYEKDIDLGLFFTKGQAKQACQDYAPSVSRGTGTNPLAWENSGTRLSRAKAGEDSRFYVSKRKVT
jgi:hypothetical protein